MGLSGPVPNLDEYRQKRGKTRPSDQKDSSRIHVKQTRPMLPSWLPSTARSCWERTVSDLIDAGIPICKLDRNILARYCMTYASWQPVAVEFAKAEAAVKDTDGGTKKNPLFQIYRDLSAEMLRMETELGLSPKARQRIAQVKDDAEPDDDGDLD